MSGEEYPQITQITQIQNLNLAEVGSAQHNLCNLRNLWILFTTTEVYRTFNAIQPTQLFKPACADRTA
jgi:hypothetical protein